MKEKATVVPIHQPQCHNEDPRLLNLDNIIHLSPTLSSAPVSSLLLSYLLARCSCFLYLLLWGRFPPPFFLSVCVPSILTIFSLRLTCLSLSGDLCVRADRDILYLSYLVLWENWCMVLNGMTDGGAIPGNPTPEEGKKLSCLEKGGGMLTELMMHLSSPFNRWIYVKPQANFVLELKGSLYHVIK